MNNPESAHLRKTKKRSEKNWRIGNIFRTLAVCFLGALLATSCGYDYDARDKKIIEETAATLSETPGALEGLLSKMPAEYFASAARISSRGSVCAGLLLGKQNATPLDTSDQVEGVQTVGVILTAAHCVISTTSANNAENYALVTPVWQNGRIGDTTHGRILDYLTATDTWGKDIDVGLWLLSGNEKYLTTFTPYPLELVGGSCASNSHLMGASLVTIRSGLTVNVSDISGIGSSKIAFLDSPPGMVELRPSRGIVPSGGSGQSLVVVDKSRKGQICSIASSSAHSPQDRLSGINGFVADLPANQALQTLVTELLAKGVEMVEAGK